jgi:hypothetical protein
LLKNYRKVLKYEKEYVEIVNEINKLSEGKHSSIISYDYLGEKIEWIFGYNSRLYHNIGIIFYVFTNMVIDIYDLGINNNYTKLYMILTTLFIISMNIKDKMTVILEIILLFIMTLIKIINVSDYVFPDQIKLLITYI